MSLTNENIRQEEAELKFNEYFLITRAIEEGIEYGYTRAHKHVENPDPEVLKDEIYNAITNHLSEIIDWEEK